MKYLIIIILASILAPSCNNSPENKALDTIKSEVYASIYSMPSPDKSDSVGIALLKAGKNMDFDAKTKMLSVDLVDFKKIPNIHRIMDSNTSHIFIGQIKEKEGYEWLTHDPDCPKCLQREWGKNE